MLINEWLGNDEEFIEKMHIITTDSKLSEESVQQNLIELLNYTPSIDIVLSALKWNKINMATTLIGSDIIESYGKTDVLPELDKFLWNNNGEITEEEFMSFVDRVTIPKEEMVHGDSDGICLGIANDGQFKILDKWSE